MVKNHSNINNEKNDDLYTKIDKMDKAQNGYIKAYFVQLLSC